MIRGISKAPVRSEWSEFSLRVRPTKLQRYQAGTSDKEERDYETDDDGDYKKSSRKKHGSKRESRKDGKDKKTSDSNIYTSDLQEACSKHRSSSSQINPHMKQRAQGRKRDRSRSPTPDSRSQRSRSRSSSSNRESESTKMTQFDLSDILGKSYKNTKTGKAITKVRDNNGNSNTTRLVTSTPAKSGSLYVVTAITPSTPLPSQKTYQGTMKSPDSGLGDMFEDMHEESLDNNLTKYNIHGHDRINQQQQIPLSKRALFPESPTTNIQAPDFNSFENPLQPELHDIFEDMLKSVDNETYDFDEANDKNSATCQLKAKILKNAIEKLAAIREDIYDKKGEMEDLEELLRALDDEDGEITEDDETDSEKNKTVVELPVRDVELTCLEEDMSRDGQTYNSDDDSDGTTIVPHVDSKADTNKLLPIRDDDLTCNEDDMTRDVPPYNSNDDSDASTTIVPVPHVYSKADNNKQGFPVGSIVWAKFSKTRWWPAMIIDGPSVRLRAAKIGWTWLMWFGDHKLSQIRQSQIELFRHHYKERCAGKLPSNVEKAIVEAVQVCANRLDIDIQGYSSIVRWGLTTNGFTDVLHNTALQDPFAPKHDQDLPTLVVKVLKKFTDEQSDISSDSDQSDITDQSGARKHLEAESPIPCDYRGTALRNKETEFGEVTFCLSCAKHSQKIVGEHPVFEGFVCHKCKVCGEHPVFEGFVCHKCKDALLESLLALDDDGCNLFCCICGEGGQLCVCETRDCGRSFCYRCMKHYLSKDSLKQLRVESPWTCFLCRPHQDTTHGMLYPRCDWQDRLVQMYNPQPTSLMSPPLRDDNKAPRKLRVLSLFDGIGTVREALDQLGLDVDMYYACDTNCDAELVSMFNHGFSVTHLGDVYNLDRNKLEEICPIDLVIGSPPAEDLDVTNVEYEGFNGTGVLMVKFLLLLKDVQMLSKGSNSVYWLVESTAAMKSEFRETVSKLFETECCMWDSGYFSPYVKPMLYWGNIPGLHSSYEFYEKSKYQDDKETLDSCLAANVNRTALVSKLRPCAIDIQEDKATDNTDTMDEIRDGVTESSDAGLISDKATGKPDTINDGDTTNNFRLPVLMAGKKSVIWIEEVERVLGLPQHYTDVAKLSVQRRQKLLKDASSVHVLKHLLRPLTHIFAMKC